MARVVEGLVVEGLDSAGVVGGEEGVVVRLSACIELSKASILGEAWKLSPKVVELTLSSSSLSPLSVGAIVVSGMGEVTGGWEGVVEVVAGVEVLMCVVLLRSCSLLSLVR